MTTLRSKSLSLKAMIIREGIVDYEEILLKGKFSDVPLYII